MENKYKDVKSLSIRVVHGLFAEECEKQGLKPVSSEWFRQTVNRGDIHEQTTKRKGRRAAYTHEPFYQGAEEEYPSPHGSRPFEVAHIDHTQVDVEALSSALEDLGDKFTQSISVSGENLGRPWLSVMIDTNTRRVLAAYLSYESPSSVSVMMVLRICVRKYGRFPQIITVDGGKEFDSIYFETLLAYFNITKKQRPPAKGRHGSIIEAFFGVLNKELWHNLLGNTKIMRCVRQVTKSVNPKNLAIWTLVKLFRILHEYVYEVYDTCPHPALDGLSPREAFATGIARAGERNHLQVSYEEFLLLSMPSPKGKFRKIQSSGIRIGYLDYWHSSFNHIAVRYTSVETKYDPFDVSVAYAFVEGTWVKCYASKYVHEFKGRTELEIEAAAAAIRKLNGFNTRKGNEITGKKLAQFLNLIEQEEVALTQQMLTAKQHVLGQRQLDSEVREIHKLIEGEGNQKDHLPTIEGSITSKNDDIERSLQLAGHGSAETDELCLPNKSDLLDKAKTSIANDLTEDEVLEEL
ncbi:Mu transposase C-terminal domain-containing protein [Leptolyngbya sp. AN02str]|uniref:Mu transposase C-terminal domain-containing protein n=1 Tax=Leptolyngbya sp. AN02str TaxID=3423363 RepID=UPI003D310F34